MFKLFQNLPIIYGLSQKADGNMHLGFSDNVLNRNVFFQKQKIAGKKIFSMDLAHGTLVEEVKSDYAEAIAPHTDGLVTADKKAILTITVADCFPVYFFDPAKNIVGLAHCGWRGTVGNIVANVISAMGSNPSDVMVGIGPGIQACHFEIKEDILPQFQKYPEAIIRKNGKVFIDLPAILTKQLNNAGVIKIGNLGECTYHNPDKYFSFRRDKPKDIQAMVAYIGLLS